MSKVNAYIQKLLKDFPKYTLNDEDKKMLEAGKKAEWMAGKLLAKRFRKAKVHEKTKQDIFNKVSLSIKENKPVYLVIGFGGYKHFWSPSHPEVDWAEFFNLRFMRDYVAPILAVHPPGAVLDYESEDVIMPLIDNYPESALEAYATSFRKLIETYSQHIPDNFKINLVRSQEQYDTSKLFKRIKEMLPEKRKVWAKLKPEEKAERLHRSPYNVLWKGKEDWTELSEEEKKRKIEESKIINETYYEADFEFRGDYFIGDNHIPIVLSWGLTYENIDNWLTLGSTYSSLVDFWVGRGILEDRGDRFVERILSQNQYNSIKDKLQILKDNSISLKNFGTIEVYQGGLDFSKG